VSGDFASGHVDRSSAWSSWTWDAARQARGGAAPAWYVAEPEFEVAEQAEFQRELGILRLEFQENKFIGRYHMAALAAQQVDAERYVFSGVASTVGNVDRMKRVILPNAFGVKAKLVPCWPITTTNGRSVPAG
jgi:hypothetical protein